MVIRPGRQVQGQKNFFDIEIGKIALNRLPDQLESPMRAHFEALAKTNRMVHIMGQNSTVLTLEFVLDFFFKFFF